MDTGHRTVTGSVLNLGRNFRLEVQDTRKKLGVTTLDRDQCMSVLAFVRVWTCMSVSFSTTNNGTTGSPTKDVSFVTNDYCKNHGHYESSEIVSLRRKLPSGRWTEKGSHSLS